MTSDDTSDQTPVVPAPAVTEKRRYPGRAVLGAGVLGGLIGSVFTAGAAVLAITFFGPPPPPPGHGPPPAACGDRSHSVSCWRCRSAQSPRLCFS